MIALVDCNNFYASCERVFNPKLLDKPIGILSNNDGVIVALSNELKQLGIKRGTPGFKVDKKLIKNHDIKLFSSNYTLYGDLSARIMRTLSKFTPKLEIYSIDEAFLSLEGFSDLTHYGRLIKKIVMKHIGIPVSVGIAPTKTLAKVANNYAKKHPETNGVFNITDHPNKDRILECLKVEDVWGIGRQYSKMLHQNNIFNAFDLTKMTDRWIEKNMTSVGLKMVRELRGISCLDLELDVPPKKEIVSSRSFGKPVTTFQEMSEAASEYCIRAVQKLRKGGQVASLITVYLTTNRFKDEPQYANYAKISLPHPSAYTPDFIRSTKIVLRNIFKDGYKYKKVGVMLSGLMHQTKAPLNLFHTAYMDDNRKILMDCIDKVNLKNGSSLITYASAGTKKEWKMKRGKLTPSYTTRWGDIPIVKAI